jgi:putative peptidoglycan lipid II flippase
MGFMLVKVLAPGYYARKNMMTPVKIGIAAMVANMAMNLLFVLPLMYYWNIGHLGLALATSLAAYLNAGLLLRGLLRERVYRAQRGWLIYSGRLLAATAAMAAVLVYLAPDTAVWLGWPWQRRAWEMAQLCTLGGIAYLFVHLLGGTRMRHLRNPV